MSKLRRYFLNHQISFLTNVTLDRQPLLVDHVDLFQFAVASAREQSNFTIVAWVVLREHFHCVIDAPEENPSEIMRRIKLSFSKRLRNLLGVQAGRVWQYRFWDHVIRNQNDLNRHIDYVHYNPVKHGYVRSAIEWPHSSFVQYVRDGFYRPEWGSTGEISFDGGFGE